MHARNATMNRLLVTLALALFALLVSTAGRAQHPGYQATGTRLLGMGGAGIAASSAGEAVWANPARLLSAESTEVLFSFRRRAEILSGMTPWAAFSSMVINEHEGLSGRRSEGSDWSGPLFSAHVPFTAGPFPVTVAFAAVQPISLDFAAEEGLRTPVAWSPALAVGVSDRVALGLSVHVWSTVKGGDDDDVEVFSSPGNGAWDPSTPPEDTPNINVTAGATWRAWQRYQQYKLDLGMIVRAPLNYDIDETMGVAWLGDQLYFANSRLELPLVLGVGAAFTIKNETVITLDLESRQRLTAPRTTSHGFHPARQPVSINNNLRELRLGFEHRLDIAALDMLLRGGYRVGSIQIWHWNPVITPDRPTTAQAVSVGLGIKVPGPINRFDIAYEQQVFDQNAGQIQGLDIDHWLAYDQRTFWLQASVDLGGLQLW